MTRCYFTEPIKVDVRAEVLPRDFLQTAGNYYYIQRLKHFKKLKNFTFKNFGNFLKALTVKLLIFKNKGLPTQRF